MGNTWILVAHEGGARLFANDGIGNGLALVESIEHPKGRARDRDLASDRPGRSFRKNSGDPRRASMGQSESPHERVVSDFSRELADKLRQARVQNQFDRLVLVAPPRFLGLLRSSLDGPTSQLIIGTIHKDLATSNEAELIQHLGEVIVI
ncbi:MAG: host attachment protein [Polyangiales bacterium]